MKSNKYLSFKSCQLTCFASKIEKGANFVYCDAEYDNALFFGKIATIISEKHNHKKYNEICEMLDSIESDKNIYDFIPKEQEAFIFETDTDKYFLGVDIIHPRDVVDLSYYL